MVLTSLTAKLSRLADQSSIPSRHIFWGGGGGGGGAFYVAPPPGMFLWHTWMLSSNLECMKGQRSGQV